MNEELERRDPRVGRARLKAKRDAGALLELADSSRWAVSPGHEIYTQYWNDESEVTVVPGEFSGYPFDLINLDTGDRVPVRHLGNDHPTFGWSIRDG